MELLAAALDEEGVAVVRFEFPYMQKRREDGRKRPPDRQPVLLDCFSGTLAQVREEVGESVPIWIGGKSMGGRMASILASISAPVDGVVCYGYPFHPPGKPDRWRVDHFPRIHCPMLILQGTRDPFGKPGELEARQPELGGCSITWLDGGNHDFKPLARSGQSQDDLIREAARQTRLFIRQARVPDL
ncbi:hypothetical protein MSNKSG1_07513 [Marinobacter santoriniensis NKSG1]|uniref:KANL3/Tex30 alpha/beta hydrolase-like domain-containing protein n=2 Tax=Marinobacter santoriniensis TaxID=523742 RepID=M7CU43_9GAMM|nr:hypothetical protein MSNKSG1_07513 [Marinobacter santoriniensis NKSG1]